MFSAEKLIIDVVFVVNFGERETKKNPQVS